jgi:hypothetical protein
MPTDEMPKPWAEHAANASAIDVVAELTRTASAQGWTINRTWTGPTYLRATKTVNRDGRRCTEQISVALVGDRLQASRVIVTDVADDMGDVIEWIEGNKQ